MKKAIIIVAVLMAFAGGILLGSVVLGKKDTDTTDTKSSEVDISADSEDKRNKENEDVDYKSLYLDFMEKNYSELKNNYSVEKFGTAYITDDEIPELFFIAPTDKSSMTTYRSENCELIRDSTTAKQSVIVYTVKDGKVEQIGNLELNTSCGFLYGEKSNTLISSSVTFEESEYSAIVYKYKDGCFEKVFDANSKHIRGAEAIKEAYGEEAYAKFTEYTEKEYPDGTGYWDQDYDITMAFLKKEGYDTQELNISAGYFFWSDFNCTSDNGETEQLNFEKCIEKYSVEIPSELYSVYYNSYFLLDADTKGLRENIIGTTEYYTFNLDNAEKLFKDNDSFTDALSTYRDKIIADSNELKSLTAVKTDLNNDGHIDVIYTLSDSNWDMFPHIALNIDGVMTEVDYSKEVAYGSQFPSGRGSDLYCDEENGIIIFRYAGHTEGTAFYHAAEAFKFDGNSLESIWTIKADNKNGSVTNEDDVNACYEEFEKRFQEKTEDYNLKALGDYSEDWE